MDNRHQSEHWHHLLGSSEQQKPLRSSNFYSSTVLRWNLTADGLGGVVSLRGTWGSLGKAAQKEHAAAPRECKLQKARTRLISNSTVWNTAGGRCCGPGSGTAPHGSAAAPHSARVHGPRGKGPAQGEQIKGKATSGASWEALTDGDQLDALPLQELEGDGDVLQLHLAEGGPLVVLAVHALLAEHLEQRDQPQPVAEVVLQVADALVDAAQVLIAPTGEGVLLDSLPGRILRQVLLGGRHLTVGIGRSAPALAPRLRAHGAAPLRPRRRRRSAPVPPGCAPPAACGQKEGERGERGERGAQRPPRAFRCRRPAALPCPKCVALRCAAPLSAAARPALHRPRAAARPLSGGSGTPSAASPPAPRRAGRRGCARLGWAGPGCGVAGLRGGRTWCARGVRNNPGAVTRGRDAAPQALLRGRAVQPPR